MALTARDSGQRTSQLLKIEDEKLALDFDRTCTARLLIYDGEREQRQLEAMSGGLLAKALGGQSAQNNGPLSGEVIGEITSANFRDQGL